MSDFATTHDALASSTNVEPRTVESFLSDTSHAPAHSKHPILNIAESMDVSGFMNLILLNKHNRIITGHSRLEAAESLRMKSAPSCISVDAGLGRRKR